MGFFEFFQSILPRSFLDPSFLKMAGMYQAFGRQFDDLKAAVADGQNQLFIDTATWGLDQYESEFGIQATDPTDQASRRNNVMAMSRGGITTTPAIMQAVLQSFGDSGIITEVPTQYKVIGQILIGQAKEYQQILRIVNRIIPAHLQFLPSFVIQEPTIVATSHSGLLTISRDVLGNNGGPNSNGLFFDGSWKLDGSKTLNNVGAGPGVAASHSDTLTITRAMQTAYNPHTDGYRPLDGSFLLDGSVIMRGTLDSTPSIAVSVKLNGIAV